MMPPRHHGHCPEYVSMPHSPTTRRSTMASVLSLLMLVTALVIGLAVTQPAHAQDDPPASRQQPPRSLDGDGKVTLNFFEADLGTVVKFMFDVKGENYIMGETNAFKEKVTIVSQKPVSPAAAWQAFLSALEVSGYTLVRTGSYYKIIKANEAVQAPLTVRGGDQSVPYSDQVITQLLPLDNISVADVQNVVNALKSRNGNIIGYQPTNTLIVTDHAYNVRKIYQVISELDIGAPKADMAIIQLKFADATEVKTIIEQLYGVGEASSASSQPAQSTSRTTRRRRRRTEEPAAPTATGSVTAGKQANYIDKVMADQRTNALIVLANETGMAAVRKLVDQLDVDATDNSRSRIYVVKLEQAKAQEVVDVLSRLSEGSGSSSSSRTPTRTTNTRSTAPAQGGAGAQDTYGAIAAFDSGMRIAHDESTNSLVIIASPEDFFIVKGVIDELDMVRKQVFVDAVILEISSDDSQEFGISAHVPQSPAADAAGFLSAQMGPSSLGLSQDLLSGVALGVFGPDSTLTVPGTDTPIPLFGVVLQAIKTYSGVEIVSNPNLMTLDNTEAKIVVGRKVPFPTNTSFNNLGQPIVTFTREDVAVSLELTPRINSENYVTLEVRVEVSEVEEDDSGLDPLLSGGPVTSKREVETTALVKNNQTFVLGGLVGTTETEVETKVPILGDVPVIGALFRGQRKQSRKSNLLIFLTPHIIEDEDDMIEVMQVKEAQFREFRRRFYGKSREAAYEEIRDLLQYSMNMVDRESMYRGSTNTSGLTVDDQPLSMETREAVRTELDRAGNVVEPGAGAGELPGDDSDLAVPVPADDGADGEGE